MLSLVALNQSIYTVHSLRWKNLDFYLYLPPVLDIPSALHSHFPGLFNAMGSMEIYAILAASGLTDGSI